MIEASESARRMHSALQRFGVPLEDILAGLPADALATKSTCGAALNAFVERLRGELSGNGVDEKQGRLVDLRLKQMEKVADGLREGPAQERFEPAELALLASFLDLTVVLVSTALGKDYRAPSP
jgi:hypothetical protein